MCAQNCWPHRPQSFNTVEFQLQPLLECQYIVYEAVIKERNGLHEALNYQLFQISQTQPQDAIRASAQFILAWCSVVWCGVVGLDIQECPLCRVMVINSALPLTTTLCSVTLQWCSVVV